MNTTIRSGKRASGFSFRHFFMTLLICMSTANGFAQGGMWPEFFVVSGGSSGTTTPLMNKNPDKIQSLYSPAHFYAASTTVRLRPGYITSVYLQCFFYSDTVTFQDFTIKLGYTDRNIMTSGPFLEGLTTVLQGNLYTLSKVGYNEWLEIPLQTPFFYDGVRNLALEVSHNGMAPGSKTTGFEWLVENLGRNLSLALVSGTNAGREAASQYVFGFDLDSRTNNAGVLALTDYSFCTGSRPVGVQVINNGMSSIDSVQVNWSLDGQLQTPVMWRGTLDTLGSAAGNTASVALGTVNAGASPVVLKVWTSSPNGQPDPVPADDTLTYVIRPSLSGVYTVGGSNPDYPTVIAAVNDLNASGICGPVTFRIRPGIYGGRADLARVKGTSAVNRITFVSETGNAADVRIIDTATTDSEKDYVFRLTETSYVTLKHLTFEDTGTRAYGRVLVLRGKTSGDSIVNCVFRAQTITSGTVSVGSSGNSRSGISAAGILGSDYVISGNRFINGATGATIGGGVYSQEYISNVHVSDNTFEKVYGCGLELTRAENVVVKNNTVTDGAVVPANNTVYGMYLNYIRNKLDISGNDMLLDSNANAYGIWLGSYRGLAEGGSLANNKVTLLRGSNNNYGFNFSTVNSEQDNKLFVVRNNVIKITGKGAGRGINISAGGNTDFLNNTVYVSNQDPARITHAVYIMNNTSTINLRLRNNIIANAGPTGYAMHVNVPMFYNGDYNNIFSAGSGYITVGTNNNNRDTFHTLAEWRDTVKQERNSLAYRPGISPSDLKPVPADTAAWSVNGRGTQWPGNDRDIDGNPRSTARANGVPDLGAYEFEPVSLPPLVKASPAVPDPGASQVFTFGEDTVAVIDWAAGSAVPPALSVRQYSGRVAPALPYDSMYFYSDLSMAGNYNFTARIYYKDPWTGTMPSEDRITLGQGDGSGPWTDYTATGITDTVRNILSAANLAMLNLFTGTNSLCMGQPSRPAILSGTYKYAVCSSSEIALNASSQDQRAGIGWQWLEGRSANGPWAPVSGGAGGNSLSYRTAPLTDTMWFRIAVFCTGSGLSDTSEAVSIPVFTPAAPAAKADTVCGAGSARLEAAVVPGQHLGWYDEAAGGKLLDTGSSFTTPTLGSTASFWVGASTGPALYTGKTTPNNASTGNSTPGSGLVFEVYEPFDLDAVDVFPTDALAGSLTVHLTDTDGNILRTAGPLAIPAGTGNSVLTGATPVRVPLSFDRIERGKYRLVAAAVTGTIILDGTGSMNYPIHIGDAGAILHATDATGNVLLSAYNYFYNWQVSAGCEGPRREVKVTVAPLPVPVISGVGAELTTGAYGSYQWQLNGQDLPGATQQTFRPAAAGNYTVRVTNEYKCAGTSAPYPYALGIAQTSDAGAPIRVYPNPAEAAIFIDAGMPVQVTLTDMTGRIVYSGRQTYSVLLKGLADGMYLLYIHSETGVLMLREKVSKLSR